LFVALDRATRWVYMRIYLASAAELQTTLMLYTSRPTTTALRSAL
jgi:hypothetical protein